MSKQLCIRFVFALTALATMPGVDGGRAAAEDTPLPWKAAVATAKITPKRPLPMAGYAGRKEPAEGAETDLYAKCVALQDQQGHRVVMVTLDLIGVLEELRTKVASEVEKRHGLPAHALLMNASHTHCGPAYGRDDTKDYFNELADHLVRIIGESLENMTPARLTYSFSKASVAMNRRTPSGDTFLNHPNPFGPVDHTVPVLSVRGEDDQLRAVVFGYACHNTTMGFRKWLGDYAGYAQQYLEEDHPGLTALFMMGCGGDQNPYPRSELKFAQQHGRTLATAVEAALEVNQRTPRHQRPVSGPLQTLLETVDLSFTKDSGRPDFPYPVQVVRFGDDVMIVALGNEVVVDYSLRLKSELTRPDGPAIWVAGYSNVYSGYVPSRRVLLEGGYEAQSRPWQPDLEERIVGKVHQLVNRTHASEQ
ncbi:MAG: neutral/alkaline non-lysosomal ceramidase N-terminal domain-containing protein [Planctomycetales bacterium]|nr:neutral/alkaline non-lysosomal ceramidase N-terminal domain-containing protein [Planctomycetales bacterium]